MTSTKRPRAGRALLHPESVLDRPFRGSDAIACGLVTRAQLRGPRYLKLFRGVFVRRTDRPPDLATWSMAAFLLLGDEGALAGYSAAELLGASCAPFGVPPEIVAPRTGIRAHPGLIVHRGSAAPEEIWRARGCRVTSPLSSAWELGRRLDRTEAVVAVDALARRGRFAPEDLLALAAQRRGARGCRRLKEIVAFCDPRAESPMETRLRMLLRDHGLPAPEVQYELLDRSGYLLARFDLAYPAAKLAIEYDGEESHRARRGPDNHRDIAAATVGWETMRFESPDIWTTPTRTADAVGRMLAARTLPR